jgi:hypothetical protein
MTARVSCPAYSFKGNQDYLTLSDFSPTVGRPGGGGMVFRPELDCVAQAEYFSATTNRKVRKVQKVAAREQN